MITVNGMTVLTTMDEILEPKRTAILVIDMQNDLCHPQGVFGQRGFDLTPLRTSINPIRRLLDGARASSIPIVYVVMTTHPGHKTWGPAYLRFNLIHLGMSNGTNYTTHGSWGWQVIDELAPQADDLVVCKWRSSGFTGTILDLTLRGRGIQTVVVCGTSTYACVESTVRDAMHYDYYTVVAPECVAGYDQDLHEAALRIMRSRIDLVSLDDILQQWRVPVRHRV